MSLERQWKLASRKHACSHTEEPFTEGQPFYTAIFWDLEEGEFRREDYCEAAWEELSGDLQAVLLLAQPLRASIRRSKEAGCR